MNSSSPARSQSPRTCLIFPLKPIPVQASRETQTPVLLRHCSNMHSINWKVCEKIT